MWQRRLNKLRIKRSISTNIKVKDEGSWAYSPEWWGSDSDHHTHSVFRASSLHANGVVSVLSYPSSQPTQVHWPDTESWLRSRYEEVCCDSRHDQDLKVLGYQWRVLRFNDVTRQSTVKVMATSTMSDPCSVYYMQQPHCLAIPYIRSMVSAGFTALSACNYDLPNAVIGKRKMRVLCVGHGGGSLPLFIASAIKGAIVDIVEIDPLVISASIRAMGFPSFSIAALPHQHVLSRPHTIDEVLWRGIHERLFLFESDAEGFILNSADTYDIIFIDAYDGDDIFPRKLWDPDSPFLEALGSRLDPCHGTVVVNLHSDADIGSPVASSQPLLPMGKYVHGVCRAYKDMLVDKKSSLYGEQLSGMGFTVSVPWICNTTLVVRRGFGDTVGALNRDLVLNALISNSLEVGRDLQLPFSCVKYLNRGFVLLD